jgi:transposase-like protein/ribosomal protein L37AE/L43A
MELFKGQSVIDFLNRFKTDLDCQEYLANIKWKDGYVCPKCGHTKFTVRKANYGHDCNRCHHIESPTAQTIFHNVKFGLQKAFIIVFEMSTTTKSFSSSQMAKRVGVSRQTAWLFMHKVRTAMQSSKSEPMTGTVIVDEFVYGGKENLKQGRSNDSKKKKVVAAVQVNENGGVKRIYFQKIKDYSSESLHKIFEDHISNEAQVKTDQWTGYKPLQAEYSITQTKSDKGSTFFEMNTMIHQVKSWLRCTFSWMHEKHIQKYLDEFSYRINRSIYKENVFDLLINRMVFSKYISFQEIKISS